MTFSPFPFAVCVLSFSCLSHINILHLKTKTKKTRKIRWKTKLNLNLIPFFSCSFTVVFRFGIVSIWVTFSMIFWKILFSASQKKTNYPTKWKRNHRRKNDHNTPKWIPIQVLLLKFKEKKSYSNFACLLFCFLYRVCFHFCSTIIFDLAYVILIQSQPCEHAQKWIHSST